MYIDVDIFVLKSQTNIFLVLNNYHFLFFNELRAIKTIKII
jgi:hypothetical protein